MKWTPEQFTQCRAEFEAKCLAGCKIVLNEDGEYHYDADHIKWLGFQAAWRPRPTVDDLMNMIPHDYNGNCGLTIVGAQDLAGRINRAYGGEKDE